MCIYERRGALTEASASAQVHPSIHVSSSHVLHDAASLHARLTVRYNMLGMKTASADGAQHACMHRDAPSRHVRMCMCMQH